MTIEEAIKRIKAHFDKWALDNEDTKAIQTLIPELHESEDEMMIYELQGFLISFGSDYFGSGEWQKFDDWLEKQKEQKPKFYPGNVIKCTSTGSLWVRCKDGDNIRSDGHTACIGGGYELASKEEAVQFFQELNENGYQWDCIKGRPMKKEQKPVEFPTTDEEVNEFLETHPKVEVPEKYKTPDFVFKKQEYESHPIISKDTTSVKPAEWSEEDEKMLRIIRLALTKHPITDKQEKDAFDWLNSLRPQPHTVSIKNATKFGNLEYERGVKDGIQSEKSRQWKPSEEQLDALRASNSYWKGTTNEVPRTDLLEQLYNDLKKLM